VIRDKGRMEDLSRCGRYSSHIRGSDTVVVMVNDKSYFASFDIGRASQNMMIAAWAEGVGSCLATLHYEERAKTLLEIPNVKEVKVAISFGYPRPNPPLTIEGKPREAILTTIGRKSIRDLVHWEKW
jgi:nitroreductase